MTPNELATMLRDIADYVEDMSEERVVSEISRSVPSVLIMDSVLAYDPLLPVDPNEYWEISIAVKPEEAE